MSNEKLEVRNEKLVTGHYLILITNYQLFPNNIKP